MLRQPPRKRALGNANLFRDFCLANVEPLGQQQQRLHREPLAHQLGKRPGLVHSTAQNQLAAKHIGNGMGRHKVSPSPAYAIWPL